MRWGRLWIKQVLRKGPKFSFKHVNFETSVRHSNEDVRQAFGESSRECRERTFFCTHAAESSLF